MEEPSSSSNCAGDSPERQISGVWGFWWIRIVLFIAHVALFVAAVSLTPEGYAFQLGATTGSLMIPGTVFMWFLLWFARTRATVLLFCGLVLAQTGLTALVAMQFRAEDRVLRQIGTEVAQRQQELTNQFAAFHLECLFAMIAPGNEFDPEELPRL